MRKWQTIESTYHYKTPFGNLRKDTCKLPNGKIIDDYYVQEYADWVNAVVLTKDQRMVFVKQDLMSNSDVMFLEERKTNE